MAELDGGVETVDQSTDANEEEVVLKTVHENANADEKFVKEVEGLTVESTEIVTDKDDDKDNDKDNDEDNDNDNDKDAENHEDKDDIRYENVWKNVDSTARASIMAFWDSLSDVKMPKSIQEARIDEVCVVVYKNATSDEVIAVSTIAIEMSNALWVNVGMFRCVVSEPYRRRHIATNLVVRCKLVMAQWSLDNPQEELLAFCTVVESRHLRRKNPKWERSGLMLVGYRQDGLQIRLAWFKHARVKY